MSTIFDLAEYDRLASIGALPDSAGVQLHKAVDDIIWKNLEARNATKKRTGQHTRMNDARPIALAFVPPVISRANPGSTKVSPWPTGSNLLLIIYRRMR